MCKKIKIDKCKQDTGIIHGPHGPNGPFLIPCYCCGIWRVDEKDIKRNQTFLGSENEYYLVCDRCRESILANQLKQFPKHSRPHDSLWAKYFKSVDSGEIDTGARFTIKPKDAKEFLNTEETKIEASVITGKPVAKTKAKKIVTNGDIAAKQHKKDTLENLKALNKQLMGQLDMIKVEREQLRRDRQEDREHIDKMSKDYHNALLEKNALWGQLETTAKRLDESERNKHQNIELVNILRRRVGQLQLEIDQLQEENAECERQVREALQANHAEMVGA